ncbi:hypothetical protein GIB67_020912 [Kingdonia uniflora]|uniref:Uncharacterized protein n=1 Tax=Kingdonia uniflora TaxID=39325 RepID=A0A7J7M7H8_9MAGN|nr:hypothetical protein GIB67_020912 [Kingdonia uniflora]
MIKIHQINNSSRFKCRRLSECCNFTPQDKEAKLLPESSNRQLGISFEDCDISNVKFSYHDALVAMFKMKRFVIHTMMIDTGNEEIAEDPPTKVFDKRAEWVTRKCWRLLTDGSAGLAGSGIRIVLITPSKYKIKKLICLDFEVSSNITEYKALIHGLDLILELSIPELLVYIDFLLFVYHYTEQYQQNVKKIDYAALITDRRLKLKCFRNQSLEMSITTPIPPTYQCLSKEEAVEADEDLYYKLIFHVFVLAGEERWDCLHTLVEDRVRASYASSFGYDAELLVRECELKGLDVRSRKLEYAHYFYEAFFHELIRDAVERERCIDESISLEYFDGDVRSNLSEGFLCYLPQLEYGLSLPHTNLAKGIINTIGAYPVQLNGNMWEVITVCDHLNDKWEREGKVRRITLKDVLQFYGVKNYKASRESYFYVSATRCCFFNLNLAGRTWNENIICVKGNYHQRDDEEPLDLWFRIVKKSVKSKVEMKESLLNEVVEEETKLELVLEGLGLSRKKRVDSLSKKVMPASGTTGSGEVTKDKRRKVEPSRESREKVVEGQSAVVDDLKEVVERARLAVLHGEEDTSKMVARLVKGIWLGIEEEKSELKKVETKANLGEMVEERDRLGHHLMLKGYSEEGVDAIKVNTYVEEENEEETEAVGIVDGLDGVSYQTVLDNQRDDVDLPKGGSEKAIREMSLRIKDLESGLTRERKTFKALLSTQAELQEFAEQFDKMKEANENREDQYVKAHFKLVEVTQAISDLTLQVEEKDAEINKGLKELAEVIESTKKVEAREHSGGSRTEAKIPLVRGDVVSLSGRIKELKSDASCIQRHVQKGNANLRECHLKLDATLIREKVLEGEIKAKESQVERKEELLKDILVREELNTEIQRLYARVADLEAIYLAESAKYIKKLEENVMYHAKVDAEMTK